MTITMKRVSRMPWKWVPMVRPKIPHVPQNIFGLSAQWAQTFWKLLKKGFIRRPYSVVCTITYIMVFLSFFQDWWTMLNWQMVSSWILEEINATTVSYVSKSHPFPFDSARITKNRNEKKITINNCPDQCHYEKD